MSFTLNLIDPNIELYSLSLVGNIEYNTLLLLKDLRATYKESPLVLKYLEDLKVLLLTLNLKEAFNLFLKGKLKYKN
jgi:hypothetical protein